VKNVYNEYTYDVVGWFPEPRRGKKNFRFLSPAKKALYDSWAGGVLTAHGGYGVLTAHGGYGVLTAHGGCEGHAGRHR
jgi:hypothetical protein